jgi:hypothetical protein
MGEAAMHPIRRQSRTRVRLCNKIAWPSFFIAMNEERARMLLFNPWAAPPAGSTTASGRRHLKVGSWRV